MKYLHTMVRVGNLEPSLDVGGIQRTGSGDAL